MDELERGLLNDEEILYRASFQESEENYIKYELAKWGIYSLLLILAWGIGFFMLIYLPIRIYVTRKDIRSRDLYITPNSIVYKLNRPLPFPCFGLVNEEKHILLPSVSDVIVEQGYLQSLFGIYSVRIENVVVRRSPRDDVKIQGIADPNAFRKAVLTHLSNLKSEITSEEAHPFNDVPNLKISHSSAASWTVPSKSPRLSSLSHHGNFMMLQKVEEVENNLKRVQSLIEEQQF